MSSIVVEGETGRDIAKQIKRVIHPRIDEVIKRGRRVIIGIAGSTSTGKSTVADYLLRELTHNYKCKLINADMFYKDNTYLLKEMYGTYDHPLLIDFEEMRSVIKHIKEGKDEVEIPVYVFETARRKGKKKENVKGVEVFLIDNLYVIEEAGDLLDIGIYVKSHSKAEQIIRRLIRDKESRLNLDYERSLDLMSSALLMYNIFGVRQERKADIIVINKHSIFQKRGVNYSEINIHDVSQIKRIKQILLERSIKKIKKIVQDYYYMTKEGDEIMRIREIIKNGLLHEVEISYKHYSFPFSLKEKDGIREEISESLLFSFRTSRKGMFVVAHTLATLSGFELVDVVRDIKRERYEVDRDLGVIIDKTKDGKERAEIFGKREKVESLLKKINDFS